VVSSASLTFAPSKPTPTAHRRHLRDFCPLANNSYETDFSLPLAASAMVQTLVFFSLISIASLPEMQSGHHGFPHIFSSLIVTI
jgi:hypothetical protein